MQAFVGCEAAYCPRSVDEIAFEPTPARHRDLRRPRLFSPYIQRHVLRDGHRGRPQCPAVRTPKLSWGEAPRHSSQDRNEDRPPNGRATGIWRDAQGALFGCGGYREPDYSRQYGFGRIDGLAAI